MDGRVKLGTRLRTSSRSSSAVAALAGGNCNSFIINSCLNQEVQIDYGSEKSIRIKYLLM